MADSRPPMCYSAAGRGAESERRGPYIGEEVLIAVPVDVARADQRLELFWRP
jgi:hypothetical protein